MTHASKNNNPKTVPRLLDGQEYYDQKAQARSLGMELCSGLLAVYTDFNPKAPKQRGPRVRESLLERMDKRLLQGSAARVQPGKTGSPRGHRAWHTGAGGDGRLSREGEETKQHDSLPPFPSPTFTRSISAPPLRAAAFATAMGRAISCTTRAIPLPSK